MPTTVVFCSQVDLELALGGARILVQLADPDKSGIAQADVVQDYLEDGAASIRSRVEIKHDPETLANLDASSLRLLQRINSRLSAKVAYLKGGLGQAMPEWIDKAAEEAERELAEIAEGTRRLGRVAGGKAAALSQPVGIIDFDKDGSGLSIAGFKKGFR